MIKREYLNNIINLVNINKKDNYNTSFISIGEYDNKTVGLSEFLYAKNRSWIKNIQGHSEIDDNYFLLLPYILQNYDEIYQNIKKNNRIILSINDNENRKIFHIIDENNLLISIYVISKNNFDKQINKRFKKIFAREGGHLLHTRIENLNCPAGPFWRHANILNKLYQNILYKSNYIDNSYAKVNIFLKIVGVRDGYHLLASRFARVKNLYDVIEFKSGSFDEFTLEGNFGCTTQQNTIYKAYLKLKEINPIVEQYFKTHKVVVNKIIPEFAGLGGGSSNSATFILMVNDICSLGLSKDQLSIIGASIGADVPFFIYEYDSANVSGIGEIVQKFDEETLNIKTFTPKIQCNTGAIFKSFRENFYKECSKKYASRLFQTKSKDIFNTLDIKEANDLYEPALSLNKNLNPKDLGLEKNSFFSGSGSSFFSII